MQLIIALDFPNKNLALKLVKQLDPKSCILKVGLELFTANGPDFVRMLVDMQFKVFLDLKFFDIPNTVAAACSAAAELGVWMINIHITGGESMLLAASRAVQAISPENRPLLIGVTRLTSMSSTIDEVVMLAKMAKASGLDGVVCSAHEVIDIKAVCGQEFITVTPGIRLPGNALHDQNRVMTPEQASKTGTDYIVMGRPIIQASEPLRVISEVMQFVM